MRFYCLTFLLATFLCSPGKAAVAPIPESEQAARALKIITQFQGTSPSTRPKQLHIVYFTPSDREPAANYQKRLGAILEDIRGFYWHEMNRSGFGQETFTLPRDKDGKLIIHLVKGKEADSEFPRWRERNGGNTGDPQGGEMVKRECQPILERAGISMDHETVLIFCHLATYDEKAGTFRHHSPYFGSWSQQSGLCFAADWAQQDLDNLTKKEPKLNDGEYGDMSLGKHMTIFLGGIAHELGHAFALPHCGERWDEKALGTSLMGGGNHTYREEERGEGPGSFLTMASAMRLAGRPLFSGFDKDESKPGKLAQSEVLLSTNITRPELAGRRGGLRVEGSVKGEPPIYAVVAYFDSKHDGGYAAPTATSVPDEQGRFAIEVSDLARCEAGELRVEFCHANGAVTEQKLGFRIAPDGSVDLTQWETRRAIQEVALAVGRNNRKQAQLAVAEVEASDAPELAKSLARKLVQTLDEKKKSSPATVSAEITELALGDAAPEAADVGWLKPAANRIPPNAEVPSAALDSGNLFATGLYAHAPSRYVFDLGGKWNKLRGEAGLHSFHQSRAYGVVFAIKGDGKELFRSKAIRDAAHAKYDLDVSGVRKLELIVEQAADRNGGNWGLWLEPTLSRFLATEKTTATKESLELPPEQKLSKDAGRGNLLFLPIKVGTGEEVSFVVDTGSSSTLVDESLEPLLGNQVGTMNMQSWGTHTKHALYKAPELRMGGVLLKTGKNVTSYDFKGLSSQTGRQVKGMLSIDCLKNYCIQMDFEAGKVRFLSAEQVNPSELGTAYSISYRDGARPFINHVSLTGGASTNCLIDSGFDVDGRVDGGTNKGRIHLAECLWDGNTYTNLTVGQGTNANIIGLKFLARHLVTLDFLNRTLYLKRQRVGPLE
ncbi:MAG TPA: NPCBM/NEW2 domain-containing protein [Candidatus Dormibacteraeota bacterium]|nr:NPCBM/NEW2 domain-containing protein [Candidatus Dormibacteraeota bacterium]